MAEVTFEAPAYFPRAPPSTRPIRCAEPLQKHKIVHYAENDVVVLAENVTQKAKVHFHLLYASDPQPFDTGRVAIVPAGMNGRVDLPAKPMTARAFDVVTVLGVLITPAERIFYAKHTETNRDMLVGPCDGGRYVPICRSSVEKVKNNDQIVAVVGNCLFATDVVPRRPPPPPWKPTDPEVRAAGAGIGVAIFPPTDFARLLATYVFHTCSTEAWKHTADDGSVVKIDGSGRFISSSRADPARFEWVPVMSTSQFSSP
jgi:hypothetical protein